MKIKARVHDQHINNPLKRLLDLSEEALASIDELKVKVLDAAEKKNALSRATNIALQTNGNYKSQEMREAHNETAIGSFRDAYTTAEACKLVQIEKVKMLRQVLSALQTYVSAEKSVAEMIGYGQDRS